MMLAKISLYCILKKKIVEKLECPIFVDVSTTEIINIPII